MLVDVSVVVGGRRGPIESFERTARIDWEGGQNSGPALRDGWIEDGVHVYIQHPSPLPITLRGVSQVAEEPIKQTK